MRHRDVQLNVAVIAALALGATASNVTAEPGADFNGDGRDDLAVGAFFESIGAATHSGAVNVLYGSATGLDDVGDQFWHQGSAGITDDAETDDRFGMFVTWGDFDNDGFDDLAIAAPYEDLGDIDNAGAVHVIYGSSAGLAAAGSQQWHQDVTGVAEVAEDGDFFGRSLTSGDYNGDGFADLAIGVPGENYGSGIDAGVVHVLFGSSSGIRATGSKLYHQNISGMADLVESGDNFGWDVASGNFNGDTRDDLAIGVPGENINDLARAGAVHILLGSVSGPLASTSQFWHQDSTLVQDVAEVGDQFGNALRAGDFDGNGRDDLAITALFEDIGTAVNCGAVNVIYGGASGLTATGNQFWHQDAAGIAELCESSEEFGWALATGDFDNDGFDDLAISAPTEDVGTVVDAGAVHVIYGSASRLNAAGSQYWHQNVGGILGTNETNDNWGDALSAGDFDNNGRADLAVGISGKNVGVVEDCGSINVIYGNIGGLRNINNQVWHQNSLGILDACESFDYLGDSAGQ